MILHQLTENANWMELNLKTFEQISLFWITPRLSYSHHLGSPKRLVSGRGLKYHAKMIKTYLDGSGSTDRPAPSFFPVLSWRFVNLNKNLLHLNITLKLALAKNDASNIKIESLPMSASPQSMMLRPQIKGCP